MRCIFKEFFVKNKNKSLFRLSNQAEDFIKSKTGVRPNVEMGVWDPPSWQDVLRNHSLEPDQFLEEFYPNLKTDPSDLFSVLVGFVNLNNAIL